MSILPVKQEGIPLELKRHKRWCLWRLEEQGNRWAKVPVTPRNKPAVVGSSRCWFTFDDVWSAYDTGLFSGIGFCLAGDGLVFVDYDSTNEPLTLDDLDDLGVRGWTERSPSGKGLHTVVVAEKTATRCKFNPAHPKIKAVEIYDRNRYFTVTGHKVSRCKSLWANQVDIDRLCNLMPKVRPIEKVAMSNPQPDHLILQRMMSSSQWQQIKPLWYGQDIQDHSIADLALLSHLGYWTGYEPKAIERLFCLSALGKRYKWIAREDYRRRSIQKVVRLATDFIGRGERNRAPNIETCG